MTLPYARWSRDPYSLLFSDSRSYLEVSPLGASRVWPCAWRHRVGQPMAQRRATARFFAITWSPHVVDSCLEVFLFFFFCRWRRRKKSFFRAFSFVTKLCDCAIVYCSMCVCACVYVSVLVWRQRKWQRRPNAEARVPFLRRGYTPSPGHARLPLSSFFHAPDHDVWRLPWRHLVARDHPKCVCCSVSLYACRVT